MPDTTTTHSQPGSNGLSQDAEVLTVNDIIGRSPGWVLHSGMSVLFIVVAVCMALTVVIRYPDKIIAAGVITTVDPYKSMVSEAAGVVDTVFVRQYDTVSEGDPIFYIRNTADREDVEAMMQILNRHGAKSNLSRWSFSSKPVHRGGRNGKEFVEEKETKFDFAGSTSIKDLMFSIRDQSYSLGLMQNTYASLEQQINEFQHFLSRENHLLKIEAIDREVEEIRDLSEVLEKEKKLTAEEVTLSEKDLQRDRELFDHGVISERDMERSQAGHIGIRKNYLLKDNNIAQNRIRIASLEQQKVDIRAARNEQILLYRSRISEIIRNLESQYREWARLYYIRAPDRGEIQLLSDLVAGQTVRSGQPIGHIIPMEKSLSLAFTAKTSPLAGVPEDQLRTPEIAASSVKGGWKTNNPKYAKVFVPSSGMGRIQTGHRAIIRLEAYPYKEYGTLETTVEEVLPIAETRDDGSRLYEIHLPLDTIFRTDYGHIIKYRPDMPVQVDIITEDRSLFERVFEQLFDLVHQHINK